MANSLDPDQGQFGGSLSVSKLFAKVISRQQRLPLARNELNGEIYQYQNLRYSFIEKLRWARERDGHGRGAFGKFLACYHNSTLR